VISLLMAGMILLNTNLTVLVTYFSPFGVERGVGPNVVVSVSEGGGPTRFCATDEDSICTVQNIPSPATVLVRATYHDPNPFFQFVCEKRVVIRQPQEYTHVQCQKIFLWFPHISAPPMAER
jgi:hypothetical protein